jgi:hypothetical protein
MNTLDGGTGLVERQGEDVEVERTLAGSHIELAGYGAAKSEPRTT